MATTLANLLENRPGNRGGGASSAMAGSRIGRSTGTILMRSPAAIRLGGARNASHSGASVWPRRFHPPGDSIGKSEKTGGELERRHLREKLVARHQREQRLEICPVEVHLDFVDRSVLLVAAGTAQIDLAWRHVVEHYIERAHPCDAGQHSRLRSDCLGVGAQHRGIDLVEVHEQSTISGRTERRSHSGRV